MRAEYALVPIDEIAKQVKVTDEEIASYYDSHKEDYRLPDEPKPKTEGARRRPSRTSPPSPRTSRSADVSGDIRQKLIASKAKEQADKVADAIMTDLQAVRDNYENMPQPLEQIARRHGAAVPDGEDGRRPRLVTQPGPDLPGARRRGAGQFAFETGANLYFPRQVESDAGPVIFQVLEYRQPETQPYEEVQDQVRADCLQPRPSTAPAPSPRS